MTRTMGFFSCCVRSFRGSFLVFQQPASPGETLFHRCAPAAELPQFAVSPGQSFFLAEADGFSQLASQGCVQETRRRIMICMGAFRRFVNDLIDNPFLK